MDKENTPFNVSISATDSLITIDTAIRFICINGRGEFSRVEYRNILFDLYALRNSLIPKADFNRIKQHCAV
jgi:hypothetical protein